MGKHFSNILKAACLGMACLLFPALSDAEPWLKVKHLANEQNIIDIPCAGKYLLLPVQDNAPEGKIYIVKDNEYVSSQPVNIRLAREQVDYYVPLDLSAFAGGSVRIDVQGMPAPSICWKHISLSDEFDSSNREKWRPAIHHTPAYGWMNDPNGMFYKDGVYHLYYQHNPYGSTWGNMHWGHSTSTDLIHWKNEPIAIAPDAWGTIFSGSCVVDKDNTAGFGEGAVVALYTSAKPTPWGDAQSQSIAYSTDGGYTFTKYEGNPVLTSEARDFRDPKVFWYAPGKHWVMMLAVGQEMKIFSSSNLKEWEEESSFGLRQGAHGGVWECPDLVELPVEGTDMKKWVLICNINPGGPFGGSATQYFVGSFDGKKFVNESPTMTKWMDWGKDNYATVTWSNVEGRTLAIGWMSNWQYQNVLPVSQFRGANTAVRELSLYVEDGDTWLKSSPVREIEQNRKPFLHKDRLQAAGEDVTVSLAEKRKMPDAYEICITVKSVRDGLTGFCLSNADGEKTDFWFDPEKSQFIMDRTCSGKADFSVDFPAVTVAPCQQGNSVELRIIVDRSSIEVFGNGGKFVMTNVVFPEKPYDTICFYGSRSNISIPSLDIYEL